MIQLFFGMAREKVSGTIISCTACALHCIVQVGSTVHCGTVSDGKQLPSFVETCTTVCGECYSILTMWLIQACCSHCHWPFVLSVKTWMEWFISALFWSSPNISVEEDIFQIVIFIVLSPIQRDVSRRPRITVTELGHNKRRVLLLIYIIIASCKFLIILPLKWLL